MLPVSDRPLLLHYRCIQNPQNPYLNPPILVYDASDFDKSARTDVRSLHNLALSEIYEAAA